MHQGQMLGRAIVVGIEDDRLLFEALGPIGNLMPSSVVSNIERGIPWDFRVQNLQEIKEGTDVYLQCAIPTRININSRRTNFRVVTPASEVYELRFEIDEKQYETKIIDLSRTGLQIKVTQDEGDSLEIDQIIDKTDLSLDAYGSREVDVRICWKAESEGSTHLGIEFHNMSSVESDELYHQVCEIERETIRRIKALEK